MEKMVAWPWRQSKKEEQQKKLIFWFDFDIIWIEIVVLKKKKFMEWARSSRNGNHFPSSAANQLMFMYLCFFICPNGEIQSWVQKLCDLEMASTTAYHTFK